MRILLLTFLLAISAKASIVTDEFVTNVGIIESNLNYNAVGDKGFAKGAWQMWRISWNEISRIRKTRGDMAYDYDLYATDPTVSRVYATEYLKWCESQFARKSGRQPSFQEIYFVFNAGIGRVAKLNFDLNNAPTVTKRACAKLNK